MKKSLLLLVATVWAVGAVAQGVAGVSAELAREDPVSAARVEVIITEDAASAIRSAALNSGRTRVTTYGVRLFSDISQDGRRNAEAARGRFTELYPGIDVRITYQNPSFLVTAGHFIDQIDAVALRGRVQSQFPRAFVVSQETSVADIVVSEKNEPIIEIEE